MPLITEKRTWSYAKKSILSVKKRSETSKTETCGVSCYMNARIFMAKGSGAWYLHVSSVFQHEFYPHEDPETTTLSQEDMDEKQFDFLKLLFENSVNNTALAKIMSGILNDDGQQGEFLTSTVKNITNNIQQAMDEMAGISHDFSVAQKTLKCLDE